MAKTLKTRVDIDDGEKEEEKKKEKRKIVVKYVDKERRKTRSWIASLCEKMR